MTIVFVDGYNMLHGCSVFKELCDIDLETARDQLIEQFIRHGAHSGEHIVLVFDGADAFDHRSAVSHTDYLDVVYTTGGMSADADIQRRLRRSKGYGDDRIVVSADNAVKIAASSMGAIAIGPEMFLRYMEHAHSERPGRPERTAERKPHHARVEELITDDDRGHLNSFRDGGSDDRSGHAE